MIVRRDLIITSWETRFDALERVKRVFFDASNLVSQLVIDLFVRWFRNPISWTTWGDPCKNSAGIRTGLWDSELLHRKIRNNCIVKFVIWDSGLLYRNIRYLKWTIPLKLREESICDVLGSLYIKPVWAYRNVCLIENSWNLCMSNICSYFEESLHALFPPPWYQSLT